MTSLTFFSDTSLLGFAVHYLMQVLHQKSQISMRGHVEWPSGFIAGLDPDWDAMD